jgi:hypothetical protein
MIVTERIARKFDAIIEAEYEVRRAHALAAMGNDMDTRFRGERDLKVCRAKLNALLDALTMEEANEFGPYRAAAKNLPLS